MVAKYKREILISILPALIISVCQVIAYVFTNDGYINLKNPSMYIAIIALTLVTMILLVAINRLVVLLDGKIVNDYKFLNVINDRAFGIFLIALLIMWLIALLALWPGLCTYDAPKRLEQLFWRKELIAHYPVLHTLLMQGCIELCDALGAGFEEGILLYSIIQAVIVALCIAYALSYIYKKMNCRWLSLICLIVIGANPVIQMLIFTTTYDIIFGGMLLVMTVLLVDSAIYSEEFFRSKLKMVALSLFAFLMCMFRNQGIYTLVLLLPFAVIAWKRYRLKMALILLIPIIITKVVTGPIYDAANIAKVNPREALSMPIQQMAYVATQHPDRIEGDEYEVLYQYIPASYIQLYNIEIADPVKAGFNPEEFSNNPVDFFKIWGRIGMRNLSSYATAFVALNYGYYYLLDTAYYETFLLMNDEDNEGMIVLTDSKLPLYEKYLEDVAADGNYKGIPMVSQALPFILMMIGMYVSLVRRRYKELVLLLLPFGYFGTLLIGPVIGIRYVFPILILIPVFLGIILNVKRGEK